MPAAMDFFSRIATARNVTTTMHIATHNMVSTRWILTSIYHERTYNYSVCGTDYALTRA